MRFNKKAALELSVTGVVVLIIAIVVLGSVIFFIRSFFGQTQDLIGQQLASVKEKLRETIDSTGEPVVMDFGRELEIKKGRPETIFVGIRNDFTSGLPGENSVCYILQVVCLRSFSGGANCGIDTRSGPADASSGIFSTVVGGYLVQGPGPQDIQSVDLGSSVLELADKRWTGSMLTIWDIENRGTDVNPVTFQISDANPDTYQMELRVFVDDKDHASCSSVDLENLDLDGSGLGVDLTQPWQTKRFLVELS